MTKSRRIARGVLLLSSLVIFTTLAPAVAQSPASRTIGLMAITTEIGPIEARIETPSVEQIHGITFTSGTVASIRVVAVRSGVGKVNAAMATALLIERFAPTAVIFSGTAGAVNGDLRPGDVIVATAIGYHDFGSFTAKGFVRRPTRSPAGDVDPVFFPADALLLEAARRAARTVKPSPLPGLEQDPLPTILEGPILTGDAFVADPAFRTDLQTSMKASAVEMEGAAVAQVCARAGVPVLVIRSITDRADGLARDSYLKYVAAASRNAADLAVATARELLSSSPDLRHP